MWYVFPLYEVRISSFQRAPGRLTTRPLPVYFATKFPFVMPFWVLSKDEI